MSFFIGFFSFFWESLSYTEQQYGQSRRVQTKSSILTASTLFASDAIAFFVAVLSEDLEGGWRDLLSYRKACAISTRVYFFKLCRSLKITCWKPTSEDGEVISRLNVCVGVEMVSIRAVRQVIPLHTRSVQSDSILLVASLYSSHNRRGLLAVNISQ